MDCKKVNHTFIPNRLNTGSFICYSATLGNKQIIQMSTFTKHPIKCFKYMEEARNKLLHLVSVSISKHIHSRLTLAECLNHFGVFQRVFAFCSFSRRWRTYPYHENSFPDVADAVVDQTGCINELILLKGLRGVCAQCLDSYLHLFGKAGHDCREKQVRRVEGGGRTKERYESQVCHICKSSFRTGARLLIRKREEKEARWKHYY